MSKVYFPNLDALRFLAFLSVFLFHSFWTDQPQVLDNGLYQFLHDATRIGHFGVNFFFVLSGFLITYLLFDEEKKYGRISLRNFYVRRILRIWPLFYLITFLLIVVFPLIYQTLKHQPLDLNISAWKYFLFLSNYDTHSTIPTLNTLWSISIEEQFYLFWPLLFVITKGRSFFYPIIFILLTSAVYRILYWRDYDAINLHTFSVISDMAIGGGLAYLAFFKVDWVKAMAAKLSTINICLIYCLSIAACYYFEFFEKGPLLTVLYRVLLALFFAFVLFEQLFAPRSVFKIGKVSIFTSLGKYTYGLYCYHYLCLYTALKIGQLLGWNRSVFGVTVLDNLVGLAISICVSIASFHFYEQFFLRLKARFEIKRLQPPLVFSSYSKP